MGQQVLHAARRAAPAQIVAVGVGAQGHLADPLGHQAGLVRLHHPQRDVGLAPQQVAHLVAGDQLHLHLRQRQPHLRQHGRQHEARHRLAGGDPNGAGAARLGAGDAARQFVGAALHGPRRIGQTQWPYRWARGRGRCARTAPLRAGFPARRCGARWSAGWNPALWRHPAGCRGRARPGTSGSGASRNHYSLLNTCYGKLGNCRTGRRFPQSSHCPRRGLGGGVRNELKGWTMNRRNFIRIAGGGVIAPAALLPVAGCSLSSDYPAEAVQAWRDAGRDERDVRRWILSHAILAPHSHNLQSWRVDLGRPDEITLYCDLSRAAAADGPAVTPDHDEPRDLPGTARSGGTAPRAACRHRAVSARRVRRRRTGHAPYGAHPPDCGCLGPTRSAVRADPAAPHQSRGLRAA